PVYFSRDVFASGNTVLLKAAPSAVAPRPARILFVVDGGVAEAHPGLIAAITAYCRDHGGALELAGPVMVIPGGEQVKNDPAPTQQVLQAIHDASLDRHSYVAAVGGGAVLDTVGYAAAMAHRGIRLIRFPTTVLSQDDSGVGVKNGINAFGQKNYLGTFTPPFAVINDSAFLATLSNRDWRGGLSEAVKAALIKDGAFFDTIEQHASRLAARDLAAMETIVRRSAELHLQHIATAGDPFETGSSRPLDFGHWAAHKLERLTDHQVRHGEAVAIGVALDTTYSYLSGFLPEGDWKRVIALLQALGLSVYAPELSHHAGDRPAVLRGLDEFREHLGGRLTIMLLTAIGVPFDAHEIDKGVMLGSIEVLRSIEGQRRPEEPHGHPIPTQPERAGR
ncbi:MAG: 3-dehydroquinate synthase, partial [Vicinamibacterales bacterium]